MKRLFCILIALLFSLTLFSSCTNTPSETTTPATTECTTTPATTECTHEWVRVENLNESTAMYECTKCQKTSLTTDPDSLPKHDPFSAPYAVLRVPGQVPHPTSDEAVLQILNKGLREANVPAANYDYIFQFDGKNLAYSSTEGIFADGAEDRHLQLSEAEKNTVNNMIQALFPTPIPCEATKVWEYHDSKSFSYTLPDGVRITHDTTGGPSGIYADGEPLDIPTFVCISFYLSDITGDGYPELCFHTSWGSGWVRDTITVYDYTTKTSMFSTTIDCNDSRCSLFLRDGILGIEQIRYDLNPETTARQTGVFAYDGTEVVILWDTEE